MTSIKIYLQYPWKFPDSPYYKYLIENPPEGIEYLNVERQKGAITNKQKLFFSNWIKWKMRASLITFNISFLNIHKTETTEHYGVIHCAHCLSKNKGPWVADFEGLWQMSVSGIISEKTMKKIRKIILQKNCKCIMAWTKEAEKEILEKIPEANGKIKVVYPAIRVNEKSTWKNKEIKILFVGRYFYAKGGLHALKVIDEITKKYPNTRGLIISDVPEKIKKEYSNNKKIEFSGLISQKKLFEEVYPQSDIFLYPGYSDTFGFSILEAMSFGLPIITADGFARREIVEDGKVGFVVEASKKRDWWDNYLHIEGEVEILKGFIDRTSLLVEDRKLREKMSKNCIEMIKNGKFSIKERNKKLKKIYEDALNE